MGGLLARQAFSSLAQPGTRTALAHINEWPFLCWIGCLPSSQAATSATRRPLTSAGSCPALPPCRQKRAHTSSSEQTRRGFIRSTAEEEEEEEEEEESKRLRSQSYPMALFAVLRASPVAAAAAPSFSCMSGRGTVCAALF